MTSTKDYQQIVKDVVSYLHFFHNIDLNERQVERLRRWIEDDE